jgi:6-phosphogluconolactonase
VNGELVVVDDLPGEFSERVIEAFHGRPEEEFCLAVSGGDTARRSYERLATDGAEQIDWWLVNIYWGDERCVPPDHPDSNERMVRQALLEKVGAAHAVYPMRCDEGPEPYQLKIGEIGRLDVTHLGLGADGHTASLFPGSAGLEADPGVLVTLNEDPSGRNPHKRLTLTYSAIARSRLVLFTVAGEEKREAMARVLAGEDIPANRVQAERVVWLVDRSALP